MTAIGLGDVAKFPFVEPPDHRSIVDGYALLDELAAVKPAPDGVKGGPVDSRRSGATSPDSRSTRGSAGWCWKPTASGACARCS